MCTLRSCSSLLVCAAGARPLANKYCDSGCDTRFVGVALHAGITMQCAAVQCKTPTCLCALVCLTLRRIDFVCCILQSPDVQSTGAFALVPLPPEVAMPTEPQPGCSSWGNAGRVSVGVVCCLVVCWRHTRVPIVSVAYIVMQQAYMSGMLLVAGRRGQ